MSDLEEFVQIAGTDLPTEGWLVYFDERGKIEGIQSPHGLSPGNYDHFQRASTKQEIFDFLASHNRPELFGAVYKLVPVMNGYEQVLRLHK